MDIQKSPTSEVPYIQMYRKEWETESKFANWLTEDKQSPNRAYCKLCKKLLVACYKNLESHSTSDLHIANQYLINGEHGIETVGANSYLIPESNLNTDIEIIIQDVSMEDSTNDQIPIPDMIPYKRWEKGKRYPYEDSDDQAYCKICKNKLTLCLCEGRIDQLNQNLKLIKTNYSDAYPDFDTNIKDTTDDHSYYVKPPYKYRREWEDDEKFADWLAPHGDSGKRAYCKICKKSLVADIVNLKSHRRSTLHKTIIKFQNRMQNGVQDTTITESTNETENENHSQLSKPNPFLNIDCLSTPNFNPSLNQYSVSNVDPDSNTPISLEEEVQSAEIHLAAFFAEHNIPFPVIESLMPLLKNIFGTPNGEQIAKNMVLGRKKCEAITKLCNVVAVNEAKNKRKRIRKKKLKLELESEEGL